MQRNVNKNQNDEQIQIIMQEYWMVNEEDKLICKPAFKWYVNHGIEEEFVKNKKKYTNIIKNEFELQKIKLLLDQARIWLLLPRIQKQTKLLKKTTKKKEFVKSFCMSFNSNFHKRTEN